jgi:hypothetical protein
MLGRCGMVVSLMQCRTLVVGIGYAGGEVRTGRASCARSRFLAALGMTARKARARGKSKTQEQKSAGKGCSVVLREGWNLDVGSCV